jgi:hypothetical protein
MDLRHRFSAVNCATVQVVIGNTRGGFESRRCLWGQSHQINVFSVNRWEQNNIRLNESKGTLQ